MTFQLGPSIRIKQRRITQGSNAASVSLPISRAPVSKSARWHHDIAVSGSSHNIFYTEEAAYILIRAIYHHAHDIGPRLFD